MKKKIFRSSKVFDGFSTCFRQWRAAETHCKYLHGYAVSFKVTFVGTLDAKNWCFDFGGFKRAETLIDGMMPSAWLNYLLDHTVIVAQDDPCLDDFHALARKGVIQLRIMKATGAEKFAEYLAETLDTFVKAETDGRVAVERLEFFENHKNSAIAVLR